MFSLAGFVGFCLVVLNPSIAYGRYERVTVTTCTDGTSALCVDCYHVGLCAIVNADPIESPCEGGMVCQETTEDESTYAVCVPEAEVPGCVCPSDPFTSIPDVYDNQKFIFCIEGEGIIQDCLGGTFYDPALEECTVDPPTTLFPPTTTLPPGSCVYEGTGLPEPVKDTCVSFRLCLQGDILTEPTLCSVNTVFNENTGECQPFEDFSCSDYPDLIGLTGDTNNCSVFHYCVNGVEQGDPLLCPENTNFNNDSSMCDANTPCTSVEGCTCTNNVTFIGYNCTNYYECVEVSADYFSPVFSACPPNFYFNTESNSCEQEVEGCPPSR